jgi:hypothetical protein
LVMIDSPAVAIPGLSAASDGFHRLPRASGNNFEVAELDLSFLTAGIHLVTVRAAKSGTPTFFSEARAFVFIDTGVLPDGGVIDVDGGGDPLDGSVEPPDAGSPNDRDPDRDGINNEMDLCPTIADPEQLDFDADGRGDACDDCAETMAGVSVDDRGCPPLDPAIAARLDQIIEAILARAFDPSLDENSDGVIDALDFAKAAKGGAR